MNNTDNLLELRNFTVYPEINLLQNHESHAEIKKVNKDEYYIEISFEGNKINEIIDSDIGFLIHAGANFPFKPPRVYCLTQFCIPCFADGRDLLEDIIDSVWNTNIEIIQIIEKIPIFLANFIERMKEGTIIFYGNYYLGEVYDINVIQNLPVYFKQIKQKIIEDSEEKVIERYLLVSDLYVLLFEDEKWSIGTNLTLVSWSTIRSIVGMKRNIEENFVKLVFKENYKKANYELIFEVDDDTDDMIGSILNVLKILGINYKKVNKSGPKKGEIPKIDIDMVEFNIKQLEGLMGTDDKIDAGPDEIKILMDFYQKAIEYYSATNNPMFETYLSRLTNLLKITANNKKLTGEEEKREITKPFNSISQFKDEEIQKSLVQTDCSNKNEAILSPTDNPKPVEKQIKSIKNKVEYTNHDGIVIDQSDNLLNFDEGNESPDSD